MSLSVQNNLTIGEKQIDFLALKKAGLVIKALNHKLRVQILKLLISKSETTVTEIYGELKLEQSVASQHLALMRRAGIVKTRRDGKFIYYSVNTTRIQQIYDVATSLL
jgi:ArsR family transcriptional regulator, virulence genes transcriptional regulator